jgi:hypothetical protein
VLKTVNSSAIIQDDGVMGKWRQKLLGVDSQRAAILLSSAQIRVAPEPRMDPRYLEMLIFYQTYSFLIYIRIIFYFV